MFVVFFGAGASALSVSILCEDLLGYYNNRELLRREEELLGQLESLEADYDIVLEQLEDDPNVVKRIAPAALGAEHDEADTAYPKARAEELGAARKALEEEKKKGMAEAAVPAWLKRCCGSLQRMVLFIAGGFLVLISFICFGPASEGQGV